MQIWLSKWITGFMGIRRHLCIIGYQTQTLFPRHSLPKNSDHIIRCRSNSAYDLRKTEWMVLADDMLQRQGCPMLIQLLCSHLEAWYSQSQVPSLLEYLRPYQSLIIQQSIPGWVNVFHGLLSTHWHSIQQAYLRKIWARISPSRWIAALQRRIWIIAWKMWKDIGISVSITSRSCRHTK